MTRDINTDLITSTVTRLCQEANSFVDERFLRAMEEAVGREDSALAKQTLNQLIENARLAREGRVPLCQDCGTAVVFLEVGQDAHVVGGDLYEAVHEGVRQGYARGYLRKSMLRQPFSARKNTGDNTPAVIHADIVAGSQLKVTVMPKGGGSENMSKLFMLTPSRGREGVVDCAVRAVDDAGSNPCPPVIVGVGIGGTAEKAMFLAKKALLREVGEPGSDPEIAELERDILERVNALGIGPQGFGGRTTAVAAHVETFPCHLASLPVAVNLQCNSARHKEAVL
ncbi:MAG: fumarate hydratase [Chloroflexota bacterium]